MAFRFMQYNPQISISQYSKTGHQHSALISTLFQPWFLDRSVTSVHNTLSPYPYGTVDLAFKTQDCSCYLQNAITEHKGGAITAPLPAPCFDSFFFVPKHSCVHVYLMSLCASADVPWGWSLSLFIYILFFLFCLPQNQAYFVSSLQLYRVN